MSDRLAAYAALALEAGPLRDLAAWEPVGSLLEEIPAAMRNQGTLSAAQVRALRRWARRWRALSPSLRAFYAAELGDGIIDPGVVEGALWRLLEGRNRPPLTGPQYGALHGRWLDRHGTRASIDLCPLPDRGAACPD